MAPSTQEPEREINYGADISNLVRLIEEGKLQNLIHHEIWIKFSLVVFDFFIFIISLLCHYLNPRRFYMI